MRYPEKLYRHARQLRGLDLRDAFAHDAERAQALALTFDNWRIDVSRQHITVETLALLREYAQEIDLPNWVAALFAGEALNVTENRAAWHTALRQADGVSVSGEVQRVRDEMKALSEAIRKNHYLGATGKPIRAVVNIGIGGSSLGTQLACDALYREGDFDVRFVSNIDEENLRRVLIGLDAETTLFVIVSKTFTTEETLSNANAAREWLNDRRDVAAALLDRHFIAVTANIERARAFGIAPESILPFWDWVGGRFSLWSAVGIGIAIQSGWQTFQAMLNGAAVMDKHFLETPVAHNVPMTLALIDWWNTCFGGKNERIIVPYAHGLRLLPSYLQQLLMESNGKRVDWDGNLLGKESNERSTVSVWGGVGTDSQHAFFQWLHQGMHQANVELIVPVAYQGKARHSGLLAHAVAQAQALMCGRDGDDVADGLRSARVCPGNRVSTMLLLPDFDAWQFGALLALYEHRAFIEGVLYRVNSFDQFGVELGKMLVRPLRDALESNIELASNDIDTATQAQLAYIRHFWKR
ncbi:MAG: glucose-6-phosphate isomerase [Burkholderiales bacterium]|jgi:glucose-6-phosphate isomerase|nr:glucose-6-phosphate isomerase [Burkholderiales bacterium]